MALKNGERVTVNFAGVVYMIFNVTRDGAFTNVVELVTDNNERMVIPAEYVSISQGNGESE